MAVYYNEIDRFAAQWLRNLIAAGLIAQGDVDERSITEVRPSDLVGYTQCHFFAGIAGWSRALRLARWSDDRPVWTGSCPCQPFSVAGAQKGFDDPRHLWPHFLRLIAECRPATIFGEQVAGASDWLSLVRGDLEALAYAVGCLPIQAASAGADHFRDRYWFVADSDSAWKLQPQRLEQNQWKRAGNGSEEVCVGVMADSDSERSQIPLGKSSNFGEKCTPTAGSDIRPLVNDPSNGCGEGWTEHEFRRRGFTAAVASIDGVQFVECSDGKWRRLPPPGVRWLGNGSAAAMARLRAVEERGFKEVINYATTSKSNPIEILRMVRQSVREETCWQEPGTRMRRQLPAPEVLLGFLLCIESACEKSIFGPGIQKTLNEIQLRVVRSVRELDGDSCSPRGRRPDEQYGDQPANPLLALSFVLARHAKAYQEEARSAHAISDLVNKLRAFGNAIDPRCAAEFIGAYMTCAP